MFAFEFKYKGGCNFLIVFYTFANTHCGDRLLRSFKKLFLLYTTNVLGFHDGSNLKRPILGEWDCRRSFKLSMPLIQNVPGIESYYVVFKLNQLLNLLLVAKSIVL